MAFAEHRNRTLQGMVRSMMIESSLHIILWGEALKTTIYLLNRIPAKATIKTPYELWTGRKPSLKHDLGGVSILVVYVDDILITGHDSIEATRLGMALTAEFEIKALGLLWYFLGLEFACSSRDIFVSQQKYVVDLLKLTGMVDCSPIWNPIKPNVKLGKGKDSPSENHHQYQHLVGKLLHLTHTRLDISFFVNLLSQFMHKPHEIHRQAPHQVLAYLKGCQGKVCCFLAALFWLSKSTQTLTFPARWLTTDPRPDIVHSSSAVLSVGRAASRTRCPAQVQKSSTVASEMGPQKASGSTWYSMSFAWSMLA